MDLLERYLQAVGKCLPLSAKDDVLAELRENLLAQMEGREEALGRPLTTSEQAQLLKEHGRPEVVAARYLPQRSLIGPGLFPFYLSVLRRVLPLVALVYTVAQAAVLIFTPPPGNRGVAVLAAIWQFWPVLLTFWAVVTGVFAVLEQTSLKPHQALESNWEPAKLPPVSAQEKTPSLTTQLFDLVAHCLGLAFVLAVPHYPFLLLGPGEGYLDRLPVGLSPQWHVFYAWIVAIMVIQLVMKALALSLDWQRKTRFLFSLIHKVLGIGIVVVMLEARVYFVPKTSASWQGLAMMNLMVNRSFQVVLLICLVDLGWGLWKYLRSTRRTGTVAFA